MRRQDFRGADDQHERDGDGFLFLILVLVVIGGIIVVGASALVGLL